MFCNIHFFQASPDGVLSKYKRTTGHKHRGAAKVLESRTIYRWVRVRDPLHSELVKVMLS